MTNTPRGYPFSPGFCHRCDDFGDLYEWDYWQPLCLKCVRGCQLAVRTDIANATSREIRNRIRGAA